MRKVTSLFKTAPVWLGSALLAGTVAFAPSAEAATLTCSPDVAGRVSGTQACEYSDTANQDFLNTSPMTVNAEEFFTFTDWSFGGKIDENAGYEGVGEGQSGTWDISSVFQNTWDDVMLVFKSGNDTTLTGYLLADGVNSGSWQSPFTKDVSHISVYYRDVPSEDVPEPGLITGLLMAGAVVVTQRHRKASSKA